LIGKKFTRVAVALIVGVSSLGVLPARAQLSDPDLGRIPGEQISHAPLTDLSPGFEGYHVADLQRALTRAGLFPGRTDGVYGRATLGAVYAFQKIYGLDRTGTFRVEDWKLLGNKIVGPGPAPEADRIEIDLDRQIMYLIQEKEVSGVFPISSANGERYRNAAGRMVNATTPEGRFIFKRNRPGWWKSYLGFLYRPFYFYGGYALHGSGSVPPFPASHGCVRVEIPDMDFLSNKIKIGMPIYLYGNKIERSDLIPAADRTPVGPTALPTTLDGGAS
jgi:hypothetical protein